jgi:hypothetical protein
VRNPSRLTGKKRKYVPSRPPLTRSAGKRRRESAPSAPPSSPPSSPSSSPLSSPLAAPHVSLPVSKKARLSRHITSSTMEKNESSGANLEWNP